MPHAKTLTFFSRPTEIIKSGYGKITYQEWCERERDRINVRGDRVHIVKREADGYIALAR